MSDENTSKIKNISLWFKKGKSELQSKDQKLDKIFWFKLIYSVVVGIAFGFGNFTGFMSFLM